jgi:hypothetical protein
LKLSREILEQQYCWQLERMVYEAQHAYANGCSYCAKAFRDMGHGLMDLTLDIVEPLNPPYYATNVRWVCSTCNREKSRTPAATWGAKRAAWEAWKRRRRVPVQRKLPWEDDDLE